MILFMEISGCQGCGGREWGMSVGRSEVSFGGDDNIWNSSDGYITEFVKNYTLRGGILWYGNYISKPLLILKSYKMMSWYFSG